VAGPNATSTPAKSEASATDQTDHPRRQDPIPDRMHRVASVTHHEVVIRWDSQRADETDNVTSDAKLTEAWRKIVAQHVDVPSMAPAFEVTARSWND
jgi:hypothetical protein